MPVPARYPQLTLWRKRRIDAGCGPVTAENARKAITSISNRLGVEPEDLPPDAVELHFEGRPEGTPGSRGNLQIFLDAWFAYLAAGCVVIPATYAPEGSTDPGHGLTDPDLIAWHKRLTRRGLAEGSIGNYIGDVVKIVNFMDIAARDISEDDIGEYFDYADARNRISKGRPLKYSYRNRMLGNIGRFASFLGIPNPGADLVNIRKDGARTQAAAESDVRRLLAFTEDAYREGGRNQARAKRALGMSKLMGFNGLRLREAQAFIPDQDLEWDRRTEQWMLIIRAGKGAQRMSDAKILADDVVVDEFLGSGRWRAGESIGVQSSSNASNSFKAWAGMAGCHITPHMLRKFYGSQLYEASGYNIALVQSQLRHADLNTTMIYIEMLPDAERDRKVTGFGTTFLQIADPAARRRQAILTAQTSRPAAYRAGGA